MAKLAKTQTHPPLPPNCSCVKLDHDAGGNCRYTLACIMRCEWADEKRARSKNRPALKDGHTPASDPLFEAYREWAESMSECDSVSEAWLAWGPRP